MHTLEQEEAVVHVMGTAPNRLVPGCRGDNEAQRRPAGVHYPWICIMLTAIRKTMAALLRITAAARSLSFKPCPIAGISLVLQRVPNAAHRRPQLRGALAPVHHVASHRDVHL